MTKNEIKYYEITNSLTSLEIIGGSKSLKHAFNAQAVHHEKARTG